MQRTEMRRASCRCLAVVLVALLGTACREEARSPSASDAAGPAASPAVDARAHRPPPAAAVRFTEPLPSPDMPLADAIGILQSRAARGDARAACRLVMEYAGCDFAQQAAAFYGASLPREARRRSPGNVAFLAVGEARAARMAEHCAGVEVASHPQRFHHLRNAARAGHLPSMVDYAMGRFSANLAILDELALYRDDGEAIAQAAARAGSLTVLQALASAYTPRGVELVASSRLAEVVTPDRRLALAYRYRIRDAIAGVGTDDAVILGADTDRAIEVLEHLADAEVRDAARAQATAWRSSWQPARFDTRGRSEAPGGARAMEDPGRLGCDDATFVDP